MRPVDALLWILAGALMGFGLVGYLTGLVLVPVGVFLAVRLLIRRATGSGFLLVGIGSGPTVLLAGDLPDDVPGALHGFVIGVGLIVVGSVVAVIQHVRSSEKRLVHRSVSRDPGAGRVAGH